MILPRLVRLAGVVKHFFSARETELSVVYLTGTLYNVLKFTVEIFLLVKGEADFLVVLSDVIPVNCLGYWSIKFVPITVVCIQNVDIDDGVIFLIYIGD